MEIRESGAGSDPQTGAPATEAQHPNTQAQEHTAPASPAAPKAAAPPRSRPLAVSAARVFNPLVLLLAGTRFLPLYGVVAHHGRRSGTAYRTPVVVRPTSDGFMVPLPWGETTDWYRNVGAAGGCVIRWKGRDYPVGQPELITDLSVVRASFGPFERAVMRRFGINHCLRLRHRKRKSR